MMQGKPRQLIRTIDAKAGQRMPARPTFYRIRIPSNFRDLLVGQTLHGMGSYYVLQTLGMGGMSVVYMAKHLESGKIYAVKTLRMQAATDELTVKRFQREAETLTYLNHPNIVRIHDYGKTSRKQPFFIMDFLTGDSLGDALKKEKLLSVERVQTIFMQVLGAVAHAHKQGLVHRDLKPGNIMLLKTRQQSDFAKVVDFGIARFEEEAQRLTRMGEVWGSPIYMSPEQCMGSQLDQRSDIYSLGIVMYEALTGQVPFFGKNYVETMSKQIGEPAKPPSSANPNVFIPDKLERIIMRTLEKEPDKRYQRVEEMLEDLHKSVEATPKKKPTRPMDQPLLDEAPQKPARRPADRTGDRTRDRSADRNTDVLYAEESDEIVEVSREYNRDNMRTTHTRARGLGNDARTSGSRYSRIRYEEKPTYNGLIIKVLLFSLFLGLSLGVVTMGVLWYDTINRAKTKQHPTHTQIEEHENFHTDFPADPAQSPS